MSPQKTMANRYLCLCLPKVACLIKHGYQQELLAAQDFVNHSKASLARVIVKEPNSHFEYNPTTRLLTSRFYSVDRYAGLAHWEPLTILDLP